MGPQDHLRALVDGTACTVCDEPVPGERVRLLARRDDLAFLELDCPACGSTTLGFVGDPGPSGAEPAEAVAPPVPARPSVPPGRVRRVAPEAARLAGGPTISADDVLDMHEALAAWTGDLVGLLEGPEPAPWPVPHARIRRPGRRRAAGPSRPTRRSA